MGGKRILLPGIFRNDGGKSFNTTVFKELMIVVESNPMLWNIK